MSYYTPTKGERPDWSALLHQAVTEPGMLLAGYRAFHRFSIANQLLAILQCAERGLEPGPIATYKSWLDKGRQVRKGEKALVLCMPVTVKAKGKAEADDDDAGATRTIFVYRPNWFVLTQTDGEPAEVEAVPGWSLERALEALNVELVEFSHTDGNTQGYAKDRTLAINPLATLPTKTAFHELAHIELGHTAKAAADTATMPRSLAEVEAEAVALLCLASLGLEGVEYCRGYIQSWGGREAIPDSSAQRIFGAANRILAAGREAEVAA